MEAALTEHYDRHLVQLPAIYMINHRAFKNGTVDYRYTTNSGPTWDIERYGMDCPAIAIPALERSAIVILLTF